MAEPFKERINHAVIQDLSSRFSRASPGFDADGFEVAATHALTGELKERVRGVARAIDASLAVPWPEALRVFQRVVGPGPDHTDALTEGMAFWPVLQVIEDHWSRDWRASLAALRLLTRSFSAEFAIRPILAAHPHEVLDELRSWTSDPDVHVRRLVSEGTRPLLPWGMRLDAVVEDPSLTLPLLVALRDDPEEYVRRSVANHLNDFAKHHPDRVAAIGAQWWNADRNRQRLVRHGLRTLLKAGHPRALAVLGFGPALVECANVRVSPDPLTLGQTLEVTADLRATGPEPQRWRVDIVLGLQGARELRQKTFVGKQIEVSPGEQVRFVWTHPLKAVTTRRYYPGTQQVTLQINGARVGSAPFELVTGS